MAFNEVNPSEGVRKRGHLDSYLTTAVGGKKSREDNVMPAKNNLQQQTNSRNDAHKNASEMSIQHQDGQMDTTASSETGTNATTGSSGITILGTQSNISVSISVL